MRKIFDNLYNKVPKKYHPLIESFDTLLYTPNHTTHSGSHIRDGIDLKRTMMFVIIALLPSLFFGMWNIGEQHFRMLGEESTFIQNFMLGAGKILPLILISYSFGLGVEFIFGIMKGHSLHEGFLVTGLLIPMIMPPDVPLWIVAIATIFAVLIGKEVFGGTGFNILNVALTARAFLFFAYPSSMSGNEVWISGFANASNKIDGVTGETALGTLASTLGKPENSEELIKISEKFSSTGEFSINHLLLGDYAGSIGETSVYCILAGALILLITKIASLRVMFSFLIGGLTTALLFYMFDGNTNYFYEINPFQQLMMGGFMFGMVFMVTDPVTSAHTATGKLIYGFLAGFLSILIRLGNPAYPEGVMLGILIANVFASLIDNMVVSMNIKKRLSRVKA